MSAGIGVDGNGGDSFGQLEALRASLARLEARVSRLEAERAPSVAGEAAGPIAAAPGSDRSRLFTGLAIVCFLLVGALLLRVLWRSGLLPPRLGVGAGLGYGLLLMAIPAIRCRLRGCAWPFAATVELCGGLLVPLVVLEAARAGVLSIATGAGILAATAATGSLALRLTGRGSLAGFLLLGQALAVAGLGLTASGIGARGLALAAIGGLGLLQRGATRAMLPMTAIPVHLLIGTALLLASGRPEVEAAAKQLLLGAGLLLFVAQLVVLLVAREPPSPFERAWLPISALLALALGALLAPRPASWIGAATAFLLLAAGGLLSRRGRAAAGSLTVAGALVALASLPWVEPRGLGLAVVALALQVWFDRLGAQLAALCALGAVAAAIAWLWSGSAASLAGTGSVLAVGGLLILLYARRSRAEHRIAAVDGAVLAGACALLLLALRGFAIRAAPGATSVHSLVLSGLLGVAAVALAAIGRRRSLRELSVLGVGCCIALAVKTLLLDLTALEGPYLIGAVSLLGGAAGGLSIALRRRASTAA